MVIFFYNFLTTQKALVKVYYGACWHFPPWSCVNCVEDRQRAPMPAAALGLWSSGEQLPNSIPAAPGASINRRVAAGTNYMPTFLLTPFAYICQVRQRLFIGDITRFSFTHTTFMCLMTFSLFYLIHNNCKSNVHRI